MKLQSECWFMYHRICAIAKFSSINKSSIDKQNEDFSDASHCFWQSISIHSRISLEIVVEKNPLSSTWSFVYVSSRKHFSISWRQRNVELSKLYEMFSNFFGGWTSLKWPSGRRKHVKQLVSFVGRSHHVLRVHHENIRRVIRASIHNRWIKRKLHQAPSWWYCELRMWLESLVKFNIFLFSVRRANLPWAGAKRNSLHLPWWVMWLPKIPRRCSWEADSLWEERKTGDLRVRRSCASW